MDKPDTTRQINYINQALLTLATVSSNEYDPNHAEAVGLIDEVFEQVDQFMTAHYGDGAS